MACHEIAALRLGLMDLLGIKDDAERSHELAELGNALETPGPLRALASARDLEALARSFADAVSTLSEKVARTPANDPKLGYLRSLLVLTRKVELDLRAQIDGLSRFHRELEEMHDFVHEIFPGG
ncbi:MAG TPA: DUF3209 family protein [Polyangiaceae bacterium]|jgi:hypothetical protein